MTAMMVESSIEDAARKHCQRLLRSDLARRHPQTVEAMVILAFAFGAAWALDRPDMIAVMNELERMRKQ